MQVNDTSYSLKELFNQVKSPAVVLGKNADIEEQALAAALIEVFTSYNQKPILISESALPEAVKPLVTSEQQKTQVEPKSLVISLDWVENNLKKVSYDMEGNKFNLIISSAGKKIDTSVLSYSHRGQEIDLLVSVGVNKLEELTNFGLDEDSLLSLPMVNFGKKGENTNFAKLNLVNASVDSLCALATAAFQEAEITLPTRAADALLFGIRTITNNFANVSDPSTFEAAAFCKRSMIPGAFTTVKREETRTEEVKEKDKKETESEKWLSPKVFRSGRIS